MFINTINNNIIIYIIYFLIFGDIRRLNVLIPLNDGLILLKTFLIVDFIIIKEIFFQFFIFIF